MTGFGDPVFNPMQDDGGDRQAASRAGATLSASRGLVTAAYTDFWQGAGVDRARLAQALPQLPDTADELNAVAKDLGVAAAVFISAAMPAKPPSSARRSPITASSISRPWTGRGRRQRPRRALARAQHPETTVGFRRRSAHGERSRAVEAQCRLGGLSACNTIAGDRPGAEALSGLARSFFYAGASALLVSHWAVSSEAATRLTVQPSTVSKPIRSSAVPRPCARRCWTISTTPPHRGTPIPRFGARLP